MHDPHPSETSLSWHLNDEGMSDSVINDILCFGNISNNYLGVFPFDALPSQTKETCMLVINVGQHFVTLYISPNFVLYVDSLGLPIMHESIKKFIERHAPSLQVFYNTKQVQSLTSSHCGFYAVLFTLLFDGKKPLLDSGCIKFFSNRKYLTRNDQKCVNYIKSIVQNQDFHACE